MSNTVDKRRALIRQMIESAGGQFASVTFIKKDGTQRVMQVQPASGKFHVKGDAASESAQQAAATRAANNPHLMNIWDVASKGFRSLNLDTVLRIAVGGTVFNVEQSA